MEKENSLGSIIGSLFGIIILVITAWWIFNIIFSEKTDSAPESSECGEGYHWEEDRLMINGTCVSDYN